MSERPERPIEEPDPESRGDLSDVPTGMPDEVPAPGGDGAGSSETSPLPDEPVTERGGSGPPAVSMVPDEPEEPESLVGSVIQDKYKVTATIGQGGMGVVVKAIDINLQREVTIKRLNDAALRSRTGTERFFREARAVAALNHRNIVSIYELAKDEHGPYIVMEYLSGGDLEKKIAEKETFSLEETIAIIKPIAKGLAYAHDKGIVHRDIKPSNIILDADGTPKVVDFGIARRDDHLDLSLTGQGIGTPAYMAPEQRTDSKRVDQRSDIFALAKTAYQMLTGNLPDTVYFDDLDPAVRPAFERALQREPEKRQSSMEAFVREFDVLAPVRGDDELISATSSSAMVCPSCDAYNKMDAQFCHNCGAGMFEECPSCYVENRVGSKFCLACGISIEKYKEGQEALRKARGYLEQADFEEAVNAAKTGLETGYHQSELEAVEKEAGEKRTTVGRLRSEIDAAIEAKDFRRAGRSARQALEIVPASRELKLKLSRIQNALYRTELEAAEREARKALEQKRYPDATVAWKRLVKIDSNHDSANELGQAIKQQESDHRRRYQEAVADRKAGRMASAMEGIRSLREDYGWDRNVAIDAESWEELEGKLEPLRAEARELEAEGKPGKALGVWQRALGVLGNDAESTEGVERTQAAWDDQKRAGGQRMRRNTLAAAAVLAVVGGVPGGLYLYEMKVTDSVDTLVDTARLAADDGNLDEGLGRLEAARAASEHPLSFVEAWRSGRDGRIEQATYELMLKEAGVKFDASELEASVARYGEVLGYAVEHGLRQPTAEQAVAPLMDRAMALLDENEDEPARELLRLSSELPGVGGSVEERLAAIDAFTSVRDELAEVREIFEGRIADLRRVVAERFEQAGADPEVGEDDERVTSLLKRAISDPSLVGASEAELVDMGLAPSARAQAMGVFLERYREVLGELEDVDSTVGGLFAARGEALKRIGETEAGWNRLELGGLGERAPQLIALGTALLDSATMSASDTVCAYENGLRLAERSERVRLVVKDLAALMSSLSGARDATRAARSEASRRFNALYEETGDALIDFGGPTAERLHAALSEAEAASASFEEGLTEVNGLAEVLLASDERSTAEVEGLTASAQALRASVEEGVKAYQVVRELLPTAMNEAALVRLARVRRNSIGMTFVGLRGGEVLLGHATRTSNEAQGIRADELRRQAVVERPYLMSRFEVTRGQYEVFLRERLAEAGMSEAERDAAIAEAAPWQRPATISRDGRVFEQDDHHPVVYVSLSEAQSFCAWLSAREPLRYRLPTEAEWEHAARGGADEAAAFSWGDRMTGAPMANGLPRDRGASAFQWEKEDTFPFTAAVGTGVEPFPANGFGIYNMHGNVAEWVIDASGMAIAKGGSWASSVLDSRIGDRQRPTEETRIEFLGFRVVAEVPEGAEMPSGLLKDQ